MNHPQAQQKAQECQEQTQKQGHQEPQGKETYRRRLWGIGTLIVVLLVSEATMQNFIKSKSVTERRQLIDCALAAGL